MITQHLPKHSGRKLFPDVRAYLEDELFPKGILPKAFLERDVPQMAILIAQALEKKNIREVGGNNRGHWVGALQSVLGAIVAKIGGTGKGEGDGAAWCMSTMETLICFIEDFMKKESPILGSEHCMTVWRAAQKVPGLTTQDCEAGSIFIGKHGSTDNGHTGLVKAKLSAFKMSTTEGNTSDSSMRDGDGLYARVRNIKANGSLKTMGFIRIYPKVAVASMPKAA